MTARILLLYATFCFASISFAKESLTLALNWKPEPEFGGFYSALIEGHFKRQGLDVTILPGGSGTPTVQMLANGKVDFAIVSADEMILANDRNTNKDNKVVAIFATYQKSPYIIMTHASRNFKTLKDVWTSPGTLALQSGLPYFQFLENKWGKPKAKVVPYLGGVGNFLSDKKFSQQGFISTEPATAQKKGAKVKNFIIADEGFNPYLVVLATTAKVARDKKATVEKLRQASRNGWNAYLRNPRETNIQMSKLNRALDLETFNQGAQLQASFIQPQGEKEVGSMEPQRWETLIKQMKEMNLIKTSPSAKDFVLTY